MEKQNNKYGTFKYHFIQILKSFPRSKVVFSLIILIKFIPMFIVSHDWKISKNSGISFWVRKFSLAEIINDFKNIYFLYSLLYIYSFLSSISIILSIYQIYSRKYNENYICYIQYLSLILNYMLSSYYLSIFIEIIFDERSKTDIPKILFYFSLFLIGLNFLFMCFCEIFISSLIIQEPFFIDNYSIFTNVLGKVNLTFFFITLIQIIVQLEFHLKQKNIIIVKTISRICICIIYLYYFISHNKFYYRYYIEIGLRFYYSLNFSSILIEFFGLIEYYKSKTFILQEDKAILYIKLFVEIALSVIFTNVFFRLDYKYIKANVVKFNSKSQESYTIHIIKMLNIIYYMDRISDFKIIMNELNNSLKNRIHTPRCKEDIKCFYCHIYNPTDFNREINEYISLSKNKIDNIPVHKYLEEKCPLFHNFLVNELTNYENIHHQWKNYFIAISIIITHFYVFKSNFIKCLYLIEKIKGIKENQINLITKLQLDIMQRKIIESYQKEKYLEKRKLVYLSKTQRKKIKNTEIFTANFNSINKLILIEKDIKFILNKYRLIMKNFYEEEISFKRYSDLITDFALQYKNYTYNLNKLFSRTKCSILYPMNKITTFFEFLTREIPKELNTPISNFFSNQVSSLIHTEKEEYIFIIYIQIINEIPKLKIKYISDDLRRKLRYSRSDFSKIDFSELFQKTFYKSYSYLIFNCLENGIDYLKIPNFCFQDKHKYICIFDFDAIILSTGQGLQLYIRLKDSKEQKVFNNNNNPRRSSMMKRKFNSQNNFCGSCFLFSNKNGKIISISKQFEDFFFINTSVLHQYVINVIDIFKISKLLTRGIFEMNLISILNNIEEIFTKEIGLISEDEFSKVIIKLKDFKEILQSIKFNFKISGSYEQRTLVKDKNKEKKYYFFILKLNLEEISKKTTENGIIKIEKLFENKMKSVTTNSLIRDDLSFINNNIEEIITPQIFEKQSSYLILIKKIKQINKLGILILRKYFKINIQKKNLDLNIDNNNNNNQTTNFDDLEILNYSEMSKKKIVEKSRVNIKKYSCFRQYFPSFLSIIFYLSLLYLFTQNIKKTNFLREYLSLFIEGNMYYQTVCQIQLKILLMAYVSNHLQEEIIDYGFNNSWDYNNNQLNLRFNDYIIFYRKYNEFITANKKVRENTKNEENIKVFTLPDFNGKKITKNLKLFDEDVHIILIPMTLLSALPIYYNNSDYYYNENMILNCNYSQLDYYNYAYSNIKFLEGFSLYFFYESNSEQNIILQNVINGEINEQEMISYLILMVAILFTFYILCLFFIFFQRTKMLFANYYLGYIRLRFFNMYIGMKIQSILDYIENYSSKINIHKKIEDIEIIENNFEDFILQNVMNDKYDKYKNIKIQPFQSKKLRTNDEDNENFEKSKINCKKEIKEISRKFSETKIVDSQKLFTVLRKNAIQYQTNQNVPSKFITPEKNTFGSNNSLRTNLNNNSNLYINTNNNTLNSNNERKTNYSGFHETNETKNSSFLINKSNITSTKSNIQLINSTNRTGYSSKSSLKLLNASVNNNSQNKSISKNNLMKAEHDTKFRFIQNGKRLLDRPILYFNFLLLLFLLTISFIGISVVQIFISIHTINLLKSVVISLINFFRYSKYTTELVYLYGLSILKNEEIKIDVELTKYDYDCEEAYKFTNLKSHTIFNELITCFDGIKKKMDLYASGDLNYKLQNTRKFLKKLYSNDFCITYSEFLSKNKDNPILGGLIYLNSITNESLYYECVHIGNGLNLKGFNIAIDTIYTTIVSYYNDFVKDNRSEISNLRRIKDKFFATCFIEIPRILRKVDIMFLINFNWDFDVIKKNTLFNTIIFFFLELILMLASTISFITQIKKFERERETSEFFNNCVINSILYK